MKFNFGVSQSEDLKQHMTKDVTALIKSIGDGEKANYLVADEVIMRIIVTTKGS